MTPRIAILPLGAHMFAALIDHGGHTSHHQVVFVSDSAAGVGLTAGEKEALVHEALAALCRTRSGAELPAVLPLIALRTDPLLLRELHARLT